MNTKLGNLQILPAVEHPELLAHSTASLLESLPDKESVGVTEIDPTLSDTAAFCEKYEIAPEVTANCVIIEATRGERRQMAACLILATTRADVNGLVRRTLDARKASFAPMEEAVRQSGMEYGAINPIGLPSDWPILIDSKIISLDQVVIGSGVRKSKIVLSGRILGTLPNAQVLEGLGQARSV
ncbi:MAG: YbaK/EbsC family protein [Candidatus Pacebacteria bacterium]|nr:YbaK/EbsC family protein [Candidatus Paceibacterota bacterium]